MAQLHHLKVVQENCTRWNPPRNIDGPVTARKIYESFKDYYAIRHVEEFIVLALNANAECIGYTVIGRGTANKVDVCLRDVFQFLLLSNAVLFALVHNHQGTPEPSESDINITRAAMDAGRLFQIGLYDAVIICGDEMLSLVRPENG